MSAPDTPPETPAIRRLGIFEFTAMMAMLFATIAFSIDAMLPALPEIAAELVPDQVNRAQLVLTFLMLGMGLGILVAGPVSDAVGRKPTILGGFLIYFAGALIAWRAQSIEVMLAARFLQGLGAAGPRVVSMALVRDLYRGREMAKVTSTVMMVFMLVPALAPSVGALIIAGFGWRAVFLAFVLFGGISCLWILSRQAETLPPARRRPLERRILWDGLREVLGDREVRIYTIVMSLGFGQMFGLLSSAQQLYTSYGQAPNFPKWFALMAVLAGTGSVFNARFVERLGMRRIATNAYLMQVVVSAGMLVVQMTLGMPFWLFFLWAVSVFFMAGVTFGNLNAMAMQSMGHVAGMVASVTGSVSTVLAMLIAAPLGLAFNGTPLPLLVGTFVCSSLALWLMHRARNSA